MLIGTPYFFSFIYCSYILLIFLIFHYITKTKNNKLNEFGVFKIFAKATHHLNIMKAMCGTIFNVNEKVLPLR